MIACYCTNCQRATLHDDTGRCTVKDCGFVAKVPLPPRIATRDEVFNAFLSEMRREVAETPEWGS